MAERVINLGLFAIFVGFLFILEGATELLWR
jgi:hypothetical protein